jgi:hypothetical protein
LLLLEKAFLAYFPKVGLCDVHAVCVSMNPVLLTFECLNQSLWTHFISHQSAYPRLSLIGDGSVEKFKWQRRIDGGVVFMRSVSY